MKSNVLFLILTLSSFSLKTEKHFDKKKEYILLLISHQHFMKSDIEEDKEEDTRSIYKGRYKSIKTV